MLDKAEYSAFESTLNSPIVSYRIVSYRMVRLRAKVTIDSIHEVEYEESIGTKMSNLDLCIEVV